jgi:glycosyltransferase involved in cell wall biosynthesis
MSGGRVLVQTNDLRLGGTQINAIQFAAQVRERGYECLVIGPRNTIVEGNSLLEVADRYGVPVEAHDIPEDSLRRASAELTMWADRWAADLVHVYSVTERNAYWGPCRFGRRPLVVTAYEMYVRPEVHRGMPLVVGTGYLRDDFADRHGGTVLISPPVDVGADAPGAVDPTGFLDAHGIPADSIRLVIVSRLDELMKAHGVEQTMRAVEQLDDPRVVLVVVGSGDAERRLGAVADEVNDRLGRRAVVMTGMMADPRPAYAAAHVSLGMGGSAARALAFGLPLVVLGENGWSRVFTPDDSAALYRNSFWSDTSDDDPVGDLAQRLKGLVNDPERRADLGAFGRGFAVTNFGLPAMGDRLADVYDRALATWGAKAWWSDWNLEVRALLSLQPFPPRPRRRLPWRR